MFVLVIEKGQNMAAACWRAGQWCARCAEPPVECSVQWWLFVGPQRLTLDGLIKGTVPGAWLWTFNGIPCTILDILEIWGGAFFGTAKGTTLSSAAPAPADVTPSLKSHYFADLHSPRKICNLSGPSGNECRMQHILLLSRSSFQLIERFAIKDEDSPLHTTKASPGGSSWKNRAWQLWFSWLCRPNTAFAPWEISQ